MAEGARLESVYTATYRGFESPSPPYFKKSSYASTGFFSHVARLRGMRSPDRGSTAGAASWTDREHRERAAPKGRAKRVNPPSPPYFKKSSYASTGFFFFSHVARLRGMRSPDRGSTAGAASWTDREHRERAAPKGRAKRVNPPHRHILRRARTQVRAFFFAYCSPAGGMRSPDRGSTTGVASWTDREHRERAAPKGRAKRVNPPSPPYFKKSSYASTGFFSHIARPWGSTAGVVRIKRNGPSHHWQEGPFVITGCRLCAYWHIMRGVLQHRSGIFLDLQL